MADAPADDRPIDDPRLRAIEAERALWRREREVGRRVARRGVFVLLSVPAILVVVVAAMLAVDSGMPLLLGLPFVVSTLGWGTAYLALGSARTRRSRRRLRALAPAGLLPAARVVRRR